MPGRVHGIPGRKTNGSGGLRVQNGEAVRSARYPWHAWPANDNKRPVWRSTLGWALVGMGIGCFAFVAMTLLA